MGAHCTKVSFESVARFAIVRQMALQLGYRVDVYGECRNSSYLVWFVITYRSCLSCETSWGMWCSSWRRRTRWRPLAVPRRRKYRKDTSSFSRVHPTLAALLPRQIRNLAPRDDSWPHSHCHFLLLTTLAGVILQSVLLVCPYHRHTYTPV